MSSLATIGDYVKATEFVGQNSAKASKGQSQKVQQAVLQKFRAGGYNVIVATSIGEEGLDIMEVDLVICFDANISPLRMIQRMGRTGRKSKGRVDILLFYLHVPHVFKPEKKLVKFSIEEFVPRGKKVKEDDAIQIPKSKLKLTDVETDLLEKYFDPARQDDWRPSLIAFPHFQAFPSRVHEIAHSMRTTMLIDTMQYLQGLSYNGPDEETSEESFKVETVDDHNSNTREDDLARKEPETDTFSLMDISKTKEQHHSFLFGSDFTTVDSNGSILILSVPHFPLKPTKSSIPENTLFLYCLKSANSKASSEDHPAIALDVNEDDLVVTSFNDLQEDKLDGDARVNSEILKGENNGTVIPNVVVDDSHSVEAGDLSPRLTNLLMSGVVPESPIHIGISNTAKGYYTALDVDKTSISLVQSKNDEAVKESTPNKEIIIPHINIPNNSIEKCASGSKFVGEIQTPLTNLSNKSCSKDWILSSGEKSISQPKKKHKRLRKFCDIKSGKEEIVGRSSISGSRSCAPLDHAFDKHGRGGRKLASSEASDDEEVDNGEDYYGGSFIDDRINPTMATTQAEKVQFDMMAVYRRSLLTQSPIVYSSPENMVSVDDGSAAGTSVHTNGDSSSSSAHLNTKRLSSDTVVIPSTTNGPDNETKRRKLSFSQGGCGPLPIRNLEKEVFLNLEATGKEVAWKMDEFDNDDDFLQGIDLDALEEQASKQLRSKSNMLNEKLKIQDFDFLDSPSFDLGI
ncbi:hypothetical protein L1987_57904 [Smallanthus sonchifolius]|uniref:Uncharacterized protein n=1 Tax=Smallanthus sonchifolius TaxID=185202 RepID=A0ACB9DEA0_9ASTR|nr:hypothetical protein L1987_57904 [Smallanthus sonchifolius]